MKKEKTKLLKIILIILLVFLIVILFSYLIIFLNSYIVSQFWKEKPDIPFFKVEKSIILKK